MNGIDQTVQEYRIVDTSPEIDPGILTQKSKRRFSARKEHGNDGKVLATTLGGDLPLQRQILLPLLPGAHLALPKTDGHRATTRQLRFQFLGPGLPRRQIPSVEKHGKRLLA